MDLSHSSTNSVVASSRAPSSSPMTSPHQSESFEITRSSSTDTSKNLGRLPLEALLLCFDHISRSPHHASPFWTDVKPLLSASTVCTSWRHFITTNPRFWRHLDLDPTLSTCEARAEWYCRMHTAVSDSVHAPSGPDAACGIYSITVSCMFQDSGILSDDECDAFFTSAVNRWTIALALLQTSSALLQLKYATLHFPYMNWISADLLRYVLNSFGSHASSRPAALYAAKHVQLSIPTFRSFPINRNFLALFSSPHITSLSIYAGQPFQYKRSMAPVPPKIRKPACIPDQVPLAMRDAVVRVWRQYTQEWQHYKEQLDEHNAQCDQEEAFDNRSFGNVKYAILAMPNLRHLTLLGCHIMSALAIPQAGLPALQHLAIRHCKWGRGFYSILNASSQLRTLEVSWGNPDPEESANVYGPHILSESAVRNIAREGLQLRERHAPLIWEMDLPEAQGLPAVFELAELPAPVSKTKSHDIGEAQHSSQCPGSVACPPQTPPRPLQGVSDSMLATGCVADLGSPDYAESLDLSDCFDSESREASPQPALLQVHDTAASFVSWPQSLFMPRELSQPGVSIISRRVERMLVEGRRKLFKHYLDITVALSSPPTAHKQPFYSISFTSPWPDLNALRRARETFVHSLQTQNTLLEQHKTAHFLTWAMPAPLLMLPELHTFHGRGPYADTIWANAPRNDGDEDSHFRRPLLHAPQLSNLHLEDCRDLSDMICAPLPTAVMTSGLLPEDIGVGSGNGESVRAQLPPDVSVVDLCVAIASECECTFIEPLHEDLYDEMDDDMAERAAENDEILDQYLWNRRRRLGWLDEGLGGSTSDFLQYVNRHYMPAVELPALFGALTVGSPNITRLSLSSLGLDDSAFTWAVCRLPQLKCLNLRDLAGVMNRSLPLVGKNCPLLEELSVTGRTAANAIGAASLLLEHRQAAITAGRAYTLHRIIVNPPWTRGPFDVEARAMAFLENHRVIPDLMAECWAASKSAGRNFAVGPSKQRDLKV